MNQPNYYPVGTPVIVTFPWRDDEQPTDANFHRGEVLEIVDAESGKYLVSGLDRIVYGDRLREDEMAINELMWDDYLREVGDYAEAVENGHLDPGQPMPQFVPYNGF